MKKYLPMVLSILIAFALCASGFAAEAAGDEDTAVYTIVVNDQTLDISDLPLAPYKEGNTVMVPLRKIGEALGYKVGWNGETKAISIDDAYIQKATLYNGTATVVFEGHLDAIDMSREIENAAKTIIHNGYIFVPMEFFAEFFNEVTVENMTVKFSPSKSELH